MAFKRKWECEYCGYEITATTEEAEGMLCPSCEGYEPAPEPEESPKWSKEERNERYRIAYHLRGSSWEGTESYMYLGNLIDGQAEVYLALNEPRSDKKHRLNKAIREGK